MDLHKKTGRIVGVLLLIIFISGIIIYQVLQGSILFGDDFLKEIANHRNQIVLSTLLGILSGLLTIVISVIMLPIIRNQNQYLGFLYIAFCILNFVAITVDNISVLTLLELSLQYVKNGSTDMTTLNIMGDVFYKNHWWTHYLSLLTSCFPVFVLFYAVYLNKLVPRAISVFGIVAVTLMFIEILFSIFENSISMNMLIPIALVQLFFPIWILIKGFALPLHSNLSN